jgi:DNA-binding NarL/FixJ family response regulator
MKTPRPRTPERQGRPNSAVVVDEWALFRHGIGTVLSGMDVKVMGEAEGYEDGMLQLWSSNPDLLVVGSIGHRSLPEFIRTVKAQYPEIRILALVPGSQAGELRPVLSSGADAVLARTASTSELEDALEQVFCGKRVLTAAAVSVLVGRVEPTAAPLATPLTSKELQVLSLLGRGMANREIADTLVLSLATVKSHLARIYGKLGAANRQEAVGRAIEAGLLA